MFVREEHQGLFLSTFDLKYVSVSATLK